MIQIPVFQDISADTTQTIELDGVLVSLRMIYNTRSASWHLWIATEADQLDAVKLVPGYAVLRYKKVLNDLPGDFLLVKSDESLDDDDVQYTDLGNGWDLYYLTASEYDDWEDARGLE